MSAEGQGEKCERARAGRGRSKTVLSGDALAALLRALHADGDVAAREYLRIHRRLVDLFARRGLACAEELADETIDRVGRRLHDGLRLHGGDPSRYFVAVARFVAREHRRATRRFDGTDAIEHWQAPDQLHDADDTTASLEESLRRLTRGERELILAYYSEEGGHNTSCAAMAAERGLSQNALRLRVHRLREKLRLMLRHPG